MADLNNYSDWVWVKCIFVSSQTNKGTRKVAAIPQQGSWATLSTHLLVFSGYCAVVGAFGVGGELKKSSEMASFSELFCVWSHCCFGASIILQRETYKQSCTLSHDLDCSLLSQIAITIITTQPPALPTHNALYFCILIIRWVIWHAGHFFFKRKNTIMANTLYTHVTFLPFRPRYQSVVWTRPSVAY